MKNKSLIQEKVVSLYLRLNGYFQTSYISHTEEWGRIGAEIDKIAVRFPNHKQPEREILSSAELLIPADSIDIIIAEVKNKEIEFNETLISKNAVKNWNQILNWLGIFEEQEIKPIIKELISITKQNGKKSDGDVKNFWQSTTNFGSITIRPIIFAFEKKYEIDEPKWWIDGITIMKFIWDCFCPENKRIDCSTRYPIGLWGQEYEGIVSYFKKRHDSGKGLGGFDDLYKELNNKY